MTESTDQTHDEPDLEVPPETDESGPTESWTEPDDVATTDIVATDLAAAVLGRLGALEDALLDFRDQADRREAIITRLFDENQALRAGELRSALGPVIGDLTRLRDVLDREADRTTAAGETSVGSLLRSLTGQVERTLRRYGIETISVAAGEPFDGTRHEAVDVVPTDDPSLDMTVAVPGAAGFVDTSTGRVIRAAAATFYRFVAIADAGPGVEASTPSDDASVMTSRAPHITDEDHQENN